MASLFLACDDAALQQKLEEVKEKGADIRKILEVLKDMLELIALKIDLEAGPAAVAGKASGVATDVVESLVRKTGLDGGLVDNKICAIDTTWSGLRFQRRRK